MEICIKPLEERYLLSAVDIWNQIVEEGVAFPQEDFLDEQSGRDFFAAQTRTAVAVEDSGEVVGMYILHPNNVGRCGHIGNASYAVRRGRRGEHIGEKLVLDSLKQARLAGFSLMQFNAVVDNNLHARHLYTRLGFHHVGAIPRGFRMKDGHFEDIHVYYHDLNGPERVRFVPSKEMKVQLLPGQGEMLSTPENIRIIIARNPDTVVAFDVFEGDDPVGFALLHNFKPGCWFLWEFAIDCRFQGRRVGARVLAQLKDYMAAHHGMHTMTTTYIYGNEPARRLYESQGFVFEREVNNDETHEIDLICYYQRNEEAQ